MSNPNEFPAFKGRIGVARRDITPPVGIYNRMWGAAMSDVAEGIHRPLNTTALAIYGENDSKPLILISFDLGWFQNPKDELIFRQPVIDAFGLDPARVVLCLSHTHAGPSIGILEEHKPGGHLIRPYIEKVAKAVLEAAKEAVANAVPAALTWRYGKCDLAVNRDMRDPNDPARILVGYNPNVVADDTLLVGRITRSDNDSPLATIVNYACHPTTLAWDNNKISPDYIGGMREVVEGATGGAPVVFILGACGELSPAEQYTGDTAVADRHGYRLGHAVMATIAGMTAPGTAMRYVRAVESGARLGLWDTGPAPIESTVDAHLYEVPLALKPQPTVEEMEAKIAACTDRAIGERLARKLKLVKFIGGATHRTMPAWCWRIGPALLFLQPNEAYSTFQMSLRKQWAGHPVVVSNLVNGSCGYLVPKELVDPDLYTYWQSPFESEGYATLLERSLSTGDALLKK